MKKIYILFPFLLAILITDVIGQTIIPAGNVSGNWPLSGSPYLIQGHIVVPADSSLTLQPGVVVVFQGHYKFNIQGNIQAIGTSSDSITFTASNITTGWWGLRFGYTPISQDSSRILFCKLVYGKANGADANGGALYFNTFSKVRVSHCLINNNVATLGGGIYCKSSSPKILSNTISANSCFSGGYGGGIYCESSASLISDNLISYNRAGITGSNGAGGGIYCKFSSDTMTNNIVTHNTTYVAGGGGISSWNSTASCVISGNDITYNTCEGDGGGVYCEYSSATITNNFISNNSSTANWVGGRGGGIGAKYSNPIITNNDINNNFALNNGGGVSCYYGGITLRNNTIRNNSCGLSGGGIYAGSTTLVENNYICNNVAYSGGGIGFDGGGKAINCVICNNSAGGNGGGIIITSLTSATAITNCSISNNKSNTSATGITYGGGGIYCTNNSDPVFTSCIIFNNDAANDNGEQIYLEDDLSDPVFSFCNIDGGSAAFYLNGNVYTGAYNNNINSNPQYIAPSLGTGNGYSGIAANWGIGLGSPCVNKGSLYTTGLGLPLMDISGTTRIIADTIDIGAFEYNSCTATSIDDSVIQSGISLTAVSPGVYQWLNCNTGYGEIPLANNQSYTPSTNGSYAVRIKKSGCLDTSACVNVTSTGIFENNLFSVFIAPNPFTNQTLITFSKEQKNTLIKIIDMFGKEINSINFTGKQLTIEREAMSNGIYFLQITDRERNVVNKKIVLQ